MDAKQKKIIALPAQPDQIDQWLTAMKSSIRTMHKPMMMARARQTERNQRRHRHAKKPKFSVGDYVLRSRVDHKHHDKLLYLVPGKKTDVHPSRLKFYADSSLEITEENREHVVAEGEVLTVEAFLDYMWNAPKKDYDILVSWKGLEPIVDSLESAKFLARGIPVLLNEFAVAREDARFERHVLALTGQHNTSD
ncbi:hypothetical protein PHMEG_00034262 [Phytophthora megakarya]|uniref:Chromo domain-containing protein n=1 Tax=Phytophthora megakarya TaxID=4795 RepID=A0A225UTZ8_9STRA|nr:hypothetical protein PHMEG_00034262 [Phytophthora megakarya]